MSARVRERWFSARPGKPAFFSRRATYSFIRRIPWTPHRRPVPRSRRPLSGDRQFPGRAASRFCGPKAPPTRRGPLPSPASRRRGAKRWGGHEMFYRVRDAGVSLDEQIEREVARLLRRSLGPHTRPASYSTEIQNARFLEDLLSRVNPGSVQLRTSGPVWECSFTTPDGERLVGSGETESLAICAAFMSQKFPKHRRLRPRAGSSISVAFRRARRRLRDLRVVRWLRRQIRKLLFP